MNGRRWAIGMALLSSAVWGCNAILGIQEPVASSGTGGAGGTGTTTSRGGAGGTSTTSTSTTESTSTSSTSTTESTSSTSTTSTSTTSTTTITGTTTVNPGSSSSTSTSTSSGAQGCLSGADCATPPMGDVYCTSGACSSGTCIYEFKTAGTQCCGAGGTCLVGLCDGSGHCQKGP